MSFVGDKIANRQYWMFVAVIRTLSLQYSKSGALLERFFKIQSSPFIHAYIFHSFDIVNMFSSTSGYVYDWRIGFSMTKFYFAKRLPGLLP
jgi:hypothetical protein